MYYDYGKRKGITVRTVHNDQLSKTIIMLVEIDQFIDEVLKFLKFKVCTGNYGDGKIFVTPVDDVYTIYTGVQDL